MLSDKKLPRVSIVQWFKDPTYSLEYPCGPLLVMTMAEFRDRGFDLVLGHFEEYDRIRINQNEAKAVFTDVDERAYLKCQKPVMISKNTGTGAFHVSPLYFRNYTLGGLRGHDEEPCSVLRPGFSPDEFWKAFDQALEESG